MKHILLSALALGAMTTFAMAQSVTPEPVTPEPVTPEPGTLTDTQMDQIKAGSQSHFPPGQFPAGNPAKAPGQSNQTGGGN
jgi:hypothetical protein